jgi:hypothetical protein
MNSHQRGESRTEKKGITLRWVSIKDSCVDGLKSKHYLVGGFNPSEKYESQLGCLFPICGKLKKCSKPPTSH